MDEDTYTELRKIAAKFFDDIQEGYEVIPRELFWWQMVNDSPTKDGNNPTSGEFKLQVPSKNRLAWCKAMNILCGYGVLYFCLLSEDNSLLRVKYTEEALDLDLYYTVSSFSRPKFFDFCKEFQISLLSPIERTYTASLRITRDNIPIVRVGNREYHFPKQSQSTLIKMLKIALLPSNRDLPLDKTKLNSEGKKEEIVDQFLGGSELNIGGNIKRLDEYGRKSKFPSALKDFYVLTEKMIVAKSFVKIDEQRLKAIKSGSKCYPRKNVKK